MTRASRVGGALQIALGILLVILGLIPMALQGFHTAGDTFGLMRIGLFLVLGAPPLLIAGVAVLFLRRRTADVAAAAVAWIYVAVTLVGGLVFAGDVEPLSIPQLNVLGVAVIFLMPALLLTWGASRRDPRHT